MQGGGLDAERRIARSTTFSRRQVLVGAGTGLGAVAIGALVPSGMERNNLFGFGLLDVEAAVSGGTDGAPTVSGIAPSNGETVSGNVTVQIDVSDAEDADDALAVEYSVDSGSWQATTYDSSSGFYENSWDSTSVSDGDHTRRSGD